MYLADICTVSVNIAGLPGISIPCGVDSNGMPIGMQIIGNKFQEEKILNTAYAFEKEFKKFINRVCRIRHSAIDCIERNFSRFTKERKYRPQFCFCNQNNCRLNCSQK